MARHSLPKLPPENRGASLWTTLRNYLLAGIAVAMPLMITAWLVIWVISIFDRVFKPLVPPAYNPETYLPFAIPGLGLVFAIIFLTMLGAITANILGRTAIGWGERLLGRLPLIRNVYGAVKQIIDTVMNQRERSFQDVALIEYPKEGMWAVCFVTASTKGDVAAALGEDFVGVFIPTTPNPTSGFLIYEKRERLKILDMTVEEGAKLIISAGLVTPEDIDEGEDTPASDQPERSSLTPSSRPNR